MTRFLKALLRLLLFAFILLNIVVAFHAYKFTHFYDQGTIVPKSNQEKNTWDRSKELLFGFNFVKQENEEPATPYKKVTLHTRNGIKLDAWLTHVPNSKGTVALFHGHGGKKSGVNNEAAAFRAMGYNTFQVDFRAHGNSEGNTCTIGYREAEDVKLAYDHLVNTGEKNIIMWGISMGAASISKAIHDHDLRPATVILEMPFASMTDAVEGRIKLMGLPPQPISTLLTFWGGIQNGFWAYSHKPSEYVKAIQCPVLLQWGQKDPRVSKAETMAIYDHINTRKKLAVYPNSGHESLFKSDSLKWKHEISQFLNP
jgi:uncharacterized protein